jgi:hypothetical protein
MVGLRYRRHPHDELLGSADLPACQRCGVPARPLRSRPAGRPRRRRRCGAPGTAALPGRARRTAGRAAEGGRGRSGPAKIRRCSGAAVSLKRKPGRIRTTRICGWRSSSLGPGSGRRWTRRAPGWEPRSVPRPGVPLHLRDLRRGFSAGRPEDGSDVRVRGKRATHAGSHVAGGARDHHTLAGMPTAVLHACASFLAVARFPSPSQGMSRVLIMPSAFSRNVSYAWGPSSSGR